METSSKTVKHPRALAVFCILFGLYHLFGAFASLVIGRWPPFMPSLLDAIAIPLSLVSQQLSIVVGALVAAALGAALLAFGTRLLAKARQA